MNSNPKTDNFSAFIQLLDPCFERSDKGPLSNLTFGVKDIFDIAGYPTSFGSPDWLNSHPIPTETSSVILSLIEKEQL